MIDSSESREEYSTHVNQIDSQNWHLRFESPVRHGELTQVINEMKQYELAVLGLREMRWTDNGQVESDGISILYSGGSKHERGVVIMLGTKNRKGRCCVGTSLS